MTGATVAVNLPALDTAVPTTPPASVACASPTSCVIGGVFGIESDAGSASFYSVAMETPGIVNLSCGSPTNCMGVTTDGSIVATNDGGSHWLNMLSPPNTGCFNSGCYAAGTVACSGPAYCIVQIGFSQLFSYGAVMYETSDLGVTWKNKSAPSSSYSCAPASTTCVGVDDRGSPGWNAAVSTGYGGTWTPITPSSPPAGAAAAISCGSPSMCLAVGGGGGAELLTSSGGTWTASTVATGSTVSLNAVSCPSAVSCMAVGDSGTVLTATVSGSSATFSPLTGKANIPSGPLDQVACDTTSSCSIFTNTTGAQTTDGGSTFSSIGVLPGTSSTIRTATCGGLGACFAAGVISAPTYYGNQESVVLSTNGITTASTFLAGTSPLVAADSYGGTDGSRPCFTCALRSAGLSAQGFNGDPVNTADGDYSESVPIVSIPGLGPNLSVTATYDSRLAQVQTISGTTTPGPFGWGWSANNSMNLSGVGGNTPTLNEEGGAQISFTPQPTGLLVAGGACTSSGTVQCFSATSGAVTAVLQENIGTPNTYAFSRNNGRTIYTFNATGQLASIANANGNSVVFTYGVTTGPNCSTAGTTCVTQREYNTGTSTWGRELDTVYTTSTGLIAKVVDPAGRSWSFAYDANNNLTGITDPRSQLESFGYDTGSANSTMVHDLISLTRPNGQASGINPGAQLAIAYEESSTASQAPLGYVIAQSDPNATFQAVHAGSPNGLTTSYSYSGNSLAATGSTTMTTTTGSSSAVVGQSEDVYLQGVLTSHIDGLNTTHPETKTFQRNSLDLPTAVTDGNGHTTSYTYDGNGNVLSSTDASGNLSTNTYNAFNELLTATPPLGSVKPQTVKTYDAAGNPVSSAQHPGTGSDLTTSNTVCESATCTVGSNTYVQGEVEKATDPKGNATTFTYDANGDLTSSTDAKGDATTFAYTLIGQQFCSTSPNATHAGATCPTSPATHVAKTTSVTFDPSNTLVSSSTDANGNSSNYTYDADGNRTITQDPLTNSTVTAFDSNGRTTQVTKASGTSAQTLTASAFDVVPAATGTCLNTVVGAVTCTVVTQASGTSIASTTAYYYDAFGNKIESVDPGGIPTFNTYDQANNLATTTMSTGAASPGLTTYAYKANNWLKSETYTSPGSGYGAISTPTSFTYSSDGSRLTMADTTGTTTYGYDAYGRPQSVTNGAGAITTYGHDAASNVTCLSYPNSGTNTCLNSSPGTGTLGIVGYSYDAANRMKSLVDWNSKTVSFGYDFNSNWNATIYPTTTNATSVSQTFGNADNLTNQTVTNANLAGGSQSTTWTPNADENFASTQANAGTANSYTYNQLNQVTSLNGTASDSYDALGRVTTSNTGATSYYGYSANSALCWKSATAPGGSTSCTSPPSGSTTYGANSINDRCFSDTTGHAGTCASPPANTTTTTYGYNQIGKLTCLTAAGNAIRNCANPISTKTTTYGYNGDGLRMTDTPAGKTPQPFIWDTNANVPMLLADGTHSYIYGPGGVPIEDITTSTSTATYLVSDPTGVRYQFKATGATNGTNSYSIYGQCLSCTAKTSFGFENGYTDANGLIYLINRYYDPATQQFISVDPLVSLTGQPFSYAGGDPVNGSDPSGLKGGPGMAAQLSCAGSSNQNACQGAYIRNYTVQAAAAASEPVCLGIVCLQFNPVQGLEGGANFIEGFGNSELGTINTLLHYGTFGQVNSNFHLNPLPFCSDNPFVGTDFQAGNNVGTIYGFIPGNPAADLVTASLYTGILKFLVHG